MTTKNVNGIIKSVEWKETTNGDEYFTLEMMRDRMQYADKYNCFNWDSFDVGDLIEGQRMTVVVEESERTNKNGNPYWNLIDIAGEDDDYNPPRHSPAPRTTSRPEPPTNRTSVPPETESPRPEALGMCQNNAVALIAAGLIPVPEGRDAISWVCEVRDTLYRSSGPLHYHDAHYCYEHSKDRQQSQKGGWFHGHVNEDGRIGWCVEGQGFVLKDQPEPEPMPEADEEEEIPF